MEIDAISPDAANRVTNLLMGAANGRREFDDPLRVETIYDEQRGRMKIILVGSMDNNALLFKLIKASLES